MMPAGTYYVGDLCYVMGPEWDEVCDLTIDRNTNRCIDGEFTLRDGRRFAVYSTAFGDGLYLDQHGNEYPVDAGLIGCIRVDDITRVGADARPNFGDLGRAFEFNEPFETSGGRWTNPNWNGTIRIGVIQIQTGDADEDDPRDYDEFED